MAGSEKSHMSLHGMIETTLATLWSEALGVERITREDNFFALGGEETSAEWVTDKIRHTLGIHMPVATLIAADTLSEFAKKVRSRRRLALSSMPPVPRIGPLQLSFEQQRLWFLSQLGGASEAYHVPLGMRLKGSLDRLALRRALDRLMVRHEVLRTTFFMLDGVGLQRITSEEVGFPLEEMDLAVEPDSEERLAELVREEAGAPFDIEQGPLIRGRLIRISTNDHVLLVTMHHIVSDGWSIGLLVQELNSLYRAFSQNQPDPLPPLTIQYPDYAAWQRRWLSSEVLAEHGAYWRDVLAGAPTLLELPTDRKHPAQQDFSGGFVVLDLDESLTAALKALSRRHGMTLFMTVLSGWALVLSRLSGEEDIVIGTPVANRTRAEVEGLIGFFVNTLAIRIDLSEAPTVEALLMRTREATLDAQEHQDLPFEQVVEQVQPVRSMAHTPLFQVMFAWQNNESAICDLPGLVVSEVAAPVSDAKFDLTLSLSEKEGEIRGGLNFATALFEPETVARYGDYLRRALLEMVVDVSRPVAAVPLLGAKERELLLTTWNATDAEYPQHLCIHQLFEQQVERSPEATAVVFEDRTLSYRELNTHANRLAHRLIDLGVVPDARVAICVERSPAMVVGLLAILKAGGAYVPLDPAYPGDRLVHILADAQPCLLLADTIGRQALGQEALNQLTVLDLDDASLDSIGEAPPPLLLSTLTSRHLAYVIYTSGSTGTPKGVMVEHRNVVNFLHSMSVTPGITSQDRLLAVTSLAFDIAGLELYLPLTKGSQVVLASRSDSIDPHVLQHALTEHRISIMQATPAMWRKLLDENWKESQGLTILCGGEAMSADLLSRFRNQGQSLWNLYGPTETTIWSSCKRISTDDENLPSNQSIGRPIANTRIYLLDAHGQPVPLGAVGELYIGGAGVARGYLNRPDLTAERFLTDPFSPTPAARMYRTGDLARYLPDGNLEFLGRNDHQVKIRGFRIEPGEIEARLTEHPAVQEAVVLAREDVPGDKRLVAYITLTPENVTGADELAAALRAYLSTRLPDYMVPAAFVRLDTLPLTPNGKLDRKALPAPEGDAYARRAYEPPQGEIEQTLAVIWEELLGVTQVSRHDNFFELGGHSLLAVRLISRLSATVGVTLPLATLFAQPTLTTLALAVTQTLEHTGVQTLPSIVPATRDGQLPLSFAQQRLWFLAQLDERISAIYHIPMALSLHGPLDTQALRRSLDALFARHEALRSVFVTTHGQPHVALLPHDAGLPLIEHDLQHIADTAVQITSLCAEEATASFDLTRGPLIRARLIRVAEHEHLFLLTQHHIVSDGWSMGVLIRELSALYRAFAQGHTDPLPPLAIQYPDYAVWQRQWLVGERLTTQADYWRHTLTDAPVLLALPTDRPRPPQQSFAGAFVPIHLDTSLTQDLKRLSQQHGTTLFVTLMAAWAAVLARLSGQNDLIIGTPTANRNRTEIEPLIGFFVNTLALRIDLSGEHSVTELLARVRQSALAAQDHQDLPFEQVVEIVQPPRHLDHTPLFQVMFAWQSNETAAFKLPDIHAEIVDQPFERVKFDFELSLADEGGCIAGKLAYASALFDAASVTRYRDYLVAFLRGMTADENRPIRQINILSTDERKRLLSAPNGIGKVKPSGCCIHEHFERHARERPAMVAVVHGEACLSYAQLNDKANILAHRLIRRGVRPDNLVGLCVARSIGTVVGILAILKAGGAYVPLDPAYPADRLAHALNDAAPAVIVLDEVGRQALGGLLDGRQQLNIDVDTWKREDAEESVANPNVPGLSLTNLAYVIYTSGSTGLPKGVMVEHAHVDRLFESTRDLFNAGPDDVWSLFHSYAFDFSVWEMWGALRHGGRLLIVPEEIAKSGPAFYRLSREQGVTMLNQTPSAFRSFIHAHVQHATSDSTLLSGRLRHVIFGGEALDPSTLKPWYEHEPLSRPRLVNMYGITETTVHVTHREIKHDDVLRSHSPVGHVLADLYVYLLDVAGQPVPWGAPGELYVGGAGVARGYLNRPELTAERFLVDPFSPVTGARIYRTGDVGRLLPDGQLEFLGRNDDQVKIRGFRIELGEVRAALETHPLVKQSVIDVQQDFDGDKRLVAYVVGSAIDTIPPAELVAGLRAHLLARLPEHMVPAAFVRIAAIPLTPSGKLDLKALPHPTADAYALASFQAPESELEQFVACVWEQVLGVERVGRNDHFFELGGHSLLAVRMLSRVEDELDLHIPLTTLFGSPTVARFTEKVLDRFAMQLESVDATYESTAEILGKDEL